MKIKDTLGMNQNISRRQFINGFACSVGAAALSSALPAMALTNPASTLYYPPKLTGMRGSHPGSFEAGHRLGREGRSAPKVDKISGEYDLVVVGGGVSGLSAARFYQQKNPNARILILDNHDDFGGHAKRNEFEVDGKLLIGYGGSQTMENPNNYSDVTKDLLADLGVDIKRFDTAFDHTFYARHNMKAGMFFEKLADAAGVLTDFSVVMVSGSRDKTKPSREQIDSLPLNKTDRDKLYELMVEPKNYLSDSDVSILDYKEALLETSYQDYLQKYCGVSDQLIKVFKQATDGGLAMAIDVAPAVIAWSYLGLPGFDGLYFDIDWITDLLMGEKDPYIHHFPDGNASIARLLVRKMIPSVAPGNTMEDIVTARFDYDQLDKPSNKVRLRLNSTAVNVEPGDKSTPAKITYIKEGEAFAVKAKHCVLACYNMIIPYLIPELKAEQAAALKNNVKSPLVYTNVALRNWKAFQKLGVNELHCADGFHSAMTLDYPVSLADYQFSQSPEDPIILHLESNPTNYGTDLDTNGRYRLGRHQLLAMSFEEIELKTRQQLQTILGPAGFDAARDIASITVNRWSHGYANHEADSVTGRKKIGNVTIANSDAGGEPTLSAAMEQGHRAVEELT